MGSDTNATFQLAPVQFSRLTRRGILLGLSLPQLAALSALPIQQPRYSR